MCEMKNIPGGINDGVDIGEEMIIELEDKVIETIQMKHIKMTEKKTHRALVFNISYSAGLPEMR